MTASSVTSAAMSAMRRVPGLLVAALLGACALTKFQAPQLSVVDVQLANASTSSAFASSSPPTTASCR